MQIWNLWHGCHKYSEGCENCYVYRIDRSHGKTDSFIVKKTSDFDLPLKKNRNGEYKLKPDGKVVFTCMTSDFFIEDADCFRNKAWEIIKSRPDLNFCIVTKRIDKALERFPNDWCDGYPNVTIACTMENQRTVNERLPIFKSLPIKHKWIFCSPLLSEINFKAVLGISSESALEGIELLSTGGESGPIARPCRWEWIKSLYRECAENNVDFHFHQIGSFFIKDERIYRLSRKLQLDEAKKAQAQLILYDK